MAKKPQDPYYKREARKYQSPIASREYIMAYLNKIGRSVSREHLQSYLEIDDPERVEALRRRLIAMERDGQVIRNRRGNYALVEQLELLRGRVVSHKDGFGFLQHELGEDIYLSPYQMRQVFSGDVVLIRVIEAKRGRKEGVIVEILERNTKQIVGRYFKEDHLSFVEPDNKTIHQDILIPADKHAGAKHGQFVAVELLAQPTIRRQATGEIVEILGDPLTPGMEIELAVRAFGLPFQWPQAVQDEVSSLTEEIDVAAIKGRKDLRQLPLVTIDGEDAKDFDDAVYCEPVSKCGWRLYVAIADVSHYVQLDTALDSEAYLRGNSVYFPGRVIPMLPRKLSNGLCSLNPNVDRLCVVCEMRIDKDGNLGRYRFYNAVMRSHARLTYTEVANMLNDKTKSNFALRPNIFELHKLFKQLQKQRRKRGSLEFDTTETRIVFGKHKKIEKIVPVIRNDAHKIIEECMLMANVCAAKFLAKHKIPALYRVHDTPSVVKIEKLRDFLKCVGLRLGGGDTPTTMDFSKLLSRTANRPDSHVIQLVVLRSLMQAVYKPTMGGHFGLAYTYYTHFTSPIRRYPDLLIHRAICHILQYQSAENYQYSNRDMVVFGEHCSMTERRADEATYEATDWLKCYYMQNKVGKVYDGIISGVTSFGVFVELKDIYVEGLVHITSLRNDYYQYRENQHCLIGKRTGVRYCLGDSIQVMIVRVDLNERKIDFDVV